MDSEVEGEQGANERVLQWKVIFVARARGMELAIWGKKLVSMHLHRHRKVVWLGASASR